MQQHGGLGLFATSPLKGRRAGHVPELWQLHKVDDGEAIINFCTFVEEIDKEECAAFLEYG
jgi:hypothetical protein